MLTILLIDIKSNNNNNGIEVVEKFNDLSNEILNLC